MITILVPFFVCLLGLLVWAVASRSKAPNEYLLKGGEVLYATGLLVTLFACATRTVTSISPAMSASLPLVVCAIGAFVWVLASNPVLKKAGFIAFAAGALVALFQVATHRLSW